MWIGRNAVLHQKDVINSLSGDTLLDLEVEKEFDAGCDSLPPAIHKWSRMLKQQLVAQSMEYKKGWLLVVRSTKESLQLSDYSLFGSSRALRRWVGLNI